MNFFEFFFSKDYLATIRPNSIAFTLLIISFALSVSKLQNPNLSIFKQFSVFLLSLTSKGFKQKIIKIFITFIKINKLLNSLCPVMITMKLCPHIEMCF
jgi:hypothetical protein